MRPRFRRLLVAIVVVHLFAARVQTQTAPVDFSAIDRVIAQPSAPRTLAVVVAHADDEGPSRPSSPGTPARVCRCS